jgi:DNA-binding MarR family transcriptional regulator
MSKRDSVPLATTLHVRDTCLCLHLQRAARAMSRRYDEALRPAHLTNGQFSLLMSLNRADPPTISEIAALLAMDRTTLTANLKPVYRRGLLSITVDEGDRRTRRLQLTAAGRAALAAAMPLWNRAQAETAHLLSGADTHRLRAALRALC